MNLQDDPMIVIPVRGQHRAFGWTQAKAIVRQLEDEEEWKAIQAAQHPPPTTDSNPEASGDEGASDESNDAAFEVGERIGSIDIDPNQNVWFSESETTTPTSLGSLKDLEVGGPTLRGKSLYLSAGPGIFVRGMMTMIRERLEPKGPDYFKALAHELAHVLYATAIEDLCEFQIAMDSTSEEFRNDREIMLELVTHCGVTWYYASDELCADKDVMMKAVQHYWCALSQASVQLRDDKDVVLRAVKHDWRCYSDASLRLRSDEDILLEAITQDGHALHHAAPILRANRELVLKAVQNDSNAARHPRSDGSFIHANEIFLHAMAIGGTDCHRDWMQRYDFQHDNVTPALAVASTELRADRELVSEALSCNWEALEYADDQLRAEKDLVLGVVKQSARALKYASEDLRADKDLRLVAARYGVPNRDKMWHQFKVHADLRGGVPYETFQQSFMAPVESVVAVQGDDNAPTLTVSLSHGPSPVGKSGKGQDEDKMSYLCRVYLMSGASFQCSVPDHPYSDRWGQLRPGPIVNDMAKKLVKELPKHTEVQGAKRVFIHVLLDEDGSAEAITPWNWDRPLSSLLQATSTTTSVTATTSTSSASSEGTGLRP